jgi:pyruvate-ferredoxin/flavodoxin oxidoreductase
MKDENCSILDGNEAAVDVAYRLVENIAIYPITPSSTMAELSDEWASKGRLNLWGTVPDVVEMQSEGGAAGAVHGSLQAGTLTTTFTASQGLLLMIPNMYKIAGELTSMCMHVTARALATHALSIFGDHSDVMACRSTGFAMLASNSVQEAHDMACIGHVASMESRIPFLHFFDGFRTSHEVNTFLKLSDQQLRQMVDDQLVREHRLRALNPDSPSIRGTAQNPDTFFQAREAINPFYNAAPDIVQGVMDRLAKVSGRQYQLFEYVGATDATKVVVIMGSGAETVEETSAWLNKHGEKTGVLKVRLFRPFSLKHFIGALPKTVQSIAVLDRTKEPGSMGEPLYQDILTALAEARTEGLSELNPKVISGRYGLGSKEFSPAMVKAVFDELSQSKPKNHFSLGIEDDLTFKSLKVDESFDLESEDVFRAIFIGLGADGTVGANKNTIKIIGDETDNYAQAYFVYDSKKSGAMTVSHLRFGAKPIRAPYLIKNARFVGCHQFSFVEKIDILKYAAPGAVVLLNSTWSKDEVWNHIPWESQRHILDKKIKLYVIDAYHVAAEAGMGQRINTIMQTCFFAISGILPREEAIAKIKKTIEKTYSKKGQAVVDGNFKAVNATLENLYEVSIIGGANLEMKLPDMVSKAAPDFIKRVTAVMMKGDGDMLPVSAFTPDGTWPTGTTRWEKRNIAIEVPNWDSSICIQCNKCALVCPHAAIRTKFYPNAALEGAPEQFHAVDFKAKEYPDHKFTIQVSPEDCTGCELCSKVCPAKDKSNPKHKALDMVNINDVRTKEQENFGFFLSIPEPDVSAMAINVKSSQFRTPLFEFSGACTGCGETPYVKLLTQLFGDRLMVANATGCSSIYGGNLPTTPYCTNGDGRGPAWANSLFEDNAEFGFGFRISLDQKQKMAKELMLKCAPHLGEGLVASILEASQVNDMEIAEQRHRVSILKQKLATASTPEAFLLTDLADNLVKKSVWIVGGDGWAYDIGYGGLDHVLASGRNVNVLVLDTEVYSNTGGQASKSTPIGAVAKFAAAGKSVAKKDMAMLAMSYGSVYVASIAFGAKDSQTVQAFVEAESYDGPSIIFAYSHCIAHGYNLSMGLEQQKNAVDTGYWPLFRFDPRREGEPKLKMDSVAPKAPLTKYMDNEGRFKMLHLQDPDRAKMLAEMSQKFVNDRYSKYQALAQSEQ